MEISGIQIFITVIYYSLIYIKKRDFIIFVELEKYNLMDLSKVT